MKKMVSMVLFCLVVGVSYAQTEPWRWSDKPGSLSITIGSPSTYSLVESNNLAQLHQGLSYFGSYTINYDYNILRWLSVGARGSYEGWQFKGNLLSDEGSAVYSFQNCHRASVLLDVRFTYINREKVQLYSGVGLGISYLFKRVEGEKFNYMMVAGALIPIGIHVGAKNVYALAELGLGTEALLSIGIGFKL